MSECDHKPLLKQLEVNPYLRECIETVRCQKCHRIFLVTRDDFRGDWYLKLESAKYMGEL
jgi:hypothetical protein